MDCNLYFGNLTSLVFLLFGIAIATSPVINNLNNSTLISEDTTDETLLYTLSVTDTDTPSSDIVCSLGASSDPANSSEYFRIRRLTSSTDWGIYTLSGAVFSHSLLSQYQLDVDCSDGTTATDGTYTVFLSQNSAPTSTNLPNTTSLSINTVIGHVVFSVLVTDTENDQIYYSLSCTPAGCPFTIHASGEILLNAQVPSAVLSYDVSVNISDAKNTVSPQLLTVQITDTNNAPAITSLITPITVQENTALNTLLTTAICTDPDTNDTLTYSMSCAPSSGLTYFQISSSNGQITTSTSSTNYEAQLTAGITSFLCVVVCSDSVLSDSANVTFDITNVNEAPKFDQIGYSVSVDEGSANTVLHSSGYNIVDPDANDTELFSLDCGVHTGYFTLDPNTGNTNFTSDYDVDEGSGPSSVSCVLTVTDSGGLTATANLSFYISNINDNSPVFIPTTYNWFVSYGASIGTTIDYVTATDADAGSFGYITYSVDQSNPNAQYFDITQAGQVYVKGNLTELAQGGTYTFNVTATDIGGLSSRAIISLFLVSTTTTSTTTTTDRTRTFFEDTRNVAWFSASCLVLATIAAVSLYLVCYYYNGPQLLSKATYSKLRCDWCKFEKKYRTVTPPYSAPEIELADEPTPRNRNFMHPQPEGPASSSTFDFWHKTEFVG